MDFYDVLFAKKLSGGGGSSVDVESLSVTENGTYTADEGKAYSPVTVNVPVGFTVEQIADRTANIGVLNVTGMTLEVMDNLFCGFKNITRVEGTNLIASSAFLKCTGMQTANVVVTNNVGIGCNSLFLNCTALKTAVVRISNTAQKPTGLFNGCSALETADLEANQLRSSMFYNNNNLATIILRNTSIVPLENTSVLSTAHFKSGGSGGTIYIPKSLYDHLGDGTSSDYQSATNWSTVHGYGTITWAKIEGTIYETQYADGTPIGS